MERTIVAVGEALADTAIDMWEHPEDSAKEITLAYIPYGDIAERLYLREDVRIFEYALETGFILFGTKYVKEVGRTGIKTLKNVGTNSTKRIDEAKSLLNHPAG